MIASMSEENNNNWSEREIGALWKQQSGKGTKYLSGHVKGAAAESSDEQLRVVVFANKDKKNSKAPDFRMYLSQPNESGPSSSTASDTDVEDVLD